MIHLRGHDERRYIQSLPGSRQGTFRNTGPAESAPTRRARTRGTEAGQTRVGLVYGCVYVLMPGVGDDVPTWVAVEEIDAVRLSLVADDRQGTELSYLDTTHDMPCLARR